MSDNKSLKIVPAPDAELAPEAKVAPQAVPEAKSEAPAKPAPRAGRKRLRMMLLILPLIALMAGGSFYLMGGRYISTDNAYVGAQKVLITPDISGKISHIAVIEGQHVKPGDELFTLDPVPYRLALRQAKAKLDAARSDYDKLKTNLASLDQAGGACAEECRAQESATSTASRSWPPRTPPRRSTSTPPRPRW